MVTVSHIGVWTPYVNPPIEAALRMIRHVEDVARFSEGFILLLEEGSSDETSSRIINAISKFVFVKNVGEYSSASELPN